MTSFEQQLKDYFQRENIKYIDNSKSYKLLDFTLPSFADDKRVYLEVKEKRQAYNVQNWDQINLDDEQYAFILDDLSARKILAYAPFSGLLIRNNLNDKYYWFSVLDLFLMPKIRVNRPINKNKQIAYKGKWIINLDDAFQGSKLDDIFYEIERYIHKREDYFLNISECFGSYKGEIIIKQGITRESKHWEIDISQTR